jgi:tripartite-type tricarboxylate transporter receptor subunit TctC
VELARVMALPEARERLALPGMQPVTGTPAELAAYLKSDIAKWRKDLASYESIVKASGAKVE